MKQLIRYTLTCSFVLLSVTLFAQKSPVGIWQTVDDNTGEARSHVEIYEKDGKFYGKIIKLLQSEPHTTCSECPGEKKDQLLVGMEILWDLKSYKDYWSYGRVLDPENGKTYKCNVYVEDGGDLRVRGYIGFSALGRNQIWNRIDKR